MNVMIFLLGGCAGWAVHSFVAARKRRKILSDVTKIIGGATDELQKIIKEMNDDEDSDNEINVKERLKVVEETAHPTDDEAEDFYLISQEQYASDSWYDKNEIDYKSGQLVSGPVFIDDARLASYVQSLAEVGLVSVGNMIHVRDPKTKCDSRITIVAV